MSDICLRNCAECFYVQGSVGIVEQTDTLKHALVSGALDGNVDTVVAPAVAEAINEMIQQGYDAGHDTPPTGEEIAVEIRQNTAGVVDKLDVARDLVVRATNGATERCTGPLKMRAKKAGQVITATVCANPILPQGTQHETVLITRERE